MQSSGKSSVLESIVGRDFLPRGSGLVFSSLVCFFYILILLWFTNFSFSGLNGLNSAEICLFVMGFLCEFQGL